MAIKYREAEDLRQSTRRSLTTTPENWMRFLRTASHTYKYNYQDQLLISAQFPNATAVAAFDVWSDRFGRRIRKGQKGIGLIDDTGRYPKMRYVFDISQSVCVRDVPQPYIWDLQEEAKSEVALFLSGDSSVSVEEAIMNFCENTVDGLIANYDDELLTAAKESDMLSGMDETAIRTEFRQAVLESVKYMALYRCGLDTSSVDRDAFRNLIDFSEVTDILGTAVSSISEQALREIETTVKTVERRNQYERNNQEQNDRRDTSPLGRGDEDILSDSQRGQGDRFDVYARSRNIHLPAEPDSDGGRERHRDMGVPSEEVSARTQGAGLSGDVRQPHADRSSDRDQRSSRNDDGHPAREDDGTGRREREAESGRLDGVGTQSELDREQSRGDRVQQSDLRISDAPESHRENRRRTPRKTEETDSPVFSSSVGDQLSMFPSEQSEQDRANEYAMSQLIRHGTSFEDGKFRIAEFFSQPHTRKEKAKFLSDEFGWGGYAGGGESMDYRPGKGITMTRTDKEHSENNISVHLTYPEVADMIDYLISTDRYITPEDIENRQNRAIYYLKNYDPDNPLEAPQIEKAKAILDSYHIDYSQLLKNQPTAEPVTPGKVEALNAAIDEDADIPDIDALPEVPEPEESVNIRNAAQSSSDVEESKMGLEAPKPDDIKIGDRFEYHGTEYTVRALQGDQPDTVKVSYIAKDSLTFTEDEIITNIDKYILAEQGAYLGRDDYLITDPVITIDKYNFTIDFDRIREISFIKQTEEYSGGLDSDGHERKDNYGVFEEETSFSLSDGYIIKYETDYGDFPCTKEQAIQDIEKLFDKSLGLNGSQIRITDREGDITFVDRNSLIMAVNDDLGLEAPKSSEELIEEAKKRINDFVTAEYDGEEANFSDLSNIGIAYTTTEDDEHIIQASVDLVNTSIIKRVDGGVISLTKYETLVDLVDALNDLDFADLTYISDEQLQEINERGNSDDDLKITSMAVSVESEQVLEDEISVELGLTESPIIDDLKEQIERTGEPLSFAAVNAAFEYFDDKQIQERSDLLLDVGWAKSTDFTIRAVINGQEYSYSGTFNFGAGNETGVIGGTLIDHFVDYNEAALMPTNPLRLSKEELEKQEQMKAVFLPFLIAHSDLSPEDQRLVDRLKRQYPVRLTREQIESLIGQSVVFLGKQYTLERIDIEYNRAIIVDHSGWQPVREDVELRHLVTQNIDLLLNEREQFFRDCDLPALLAKSSLAWDEIESLGYIFYEPGYIDRVKPTDAAHYGNGFFAQTEAFELARRYQGGEDISKELAERLFLRPNKNIPMTSIPYEESYVDDLDLTIRQTESGFYVNYGAYSREVTFDELARAYLRYFAIENNAIRQEAAEEEAQTTDQTAQQEPEVADQTVVVPPQDNPDLIAEKTFAEQVDEVLDGRMPFYSALKVSDTPEILLSVGCKQLPMLYTQKHLKDAIKPKNKKGHTHGLDVEQIKRLDQLIASPLMVMDSLTKNNSILVVTSEIDSDGLPIMVSVTPNGKGRYELEEVDSNFITSVYGRNNFPEFFKRVVESDNLLYCSKKVK